ncbi:Crp/Fnr family transcriptional regulator [Thermus scotoductus]|uniref:Crp/Fnr family transcriptional regulator n=1 Tax=Thermus scotoductus TaxID=37636 RepID=A0A430SDM9_THESC|nr:cyclic nucleotide-binding domain-containing protein [Thermus scotoductus]RTG97858.1 Crp/Fnr family transcriptional regulator [Thermus scotoductus]RTH12995.1 Crp/Fnr family transcriptional regulator [Thermus scotoductus]RTH13846.1 Crp/Fnr family transcriptional regulator [Thermus scotoductus]RTH14791.1 Crp/Fnr family transcriptional regulator [Thermus scotoductus]RTH19915.1 Crp/Fnr family transcriptional regulator [Thermus scotoductus]
MKRFNRKELVFLAGDRADTLYRLQSGLVRIVELLPDGRTLTLRHVLPGDFFGEEALEGKRYRYAAETMTDVVVEGFDPKTMDHQALHQVARNLARQMRRVQAYEAHLQTGELRARIARYLVFLSDTPASFRDEQGLFVTVSHEEIADATASTRESVSKILSDLRYEGLIATAYRKVYLFNLKALEQEAQGALEAA